jgi:hypothetical protein
MEPYGAQDRGKSMEIQERCPSLGLTETVKVCQSTELDYLDSHGLWMPLACVVQVLNWSRHVILFEANSCGSPDAMVQWRPCSPRGRLKFCVLGCFWYFLVSGFRYEMTRTAKTNSLAMSRSPFLTSCQGPALEKVLKDLRPKYSKMLFVRSPADWVVRCIWYHVIAY